MTLALYGKSRRHQVYLVALAIFAVLAAALAGSQALREAPAWAQQSSEPATSPAALTAIDGDTALLAQGESLTVDFANPLPADATVESASIEIYGRIVACQDEQPEEETVGSACAEPVASTQLQAVSGASLGTRVSWASGDYAWVTHPVDASHMQELAASAPISVVVQLVDGADLEIDAARLDLEWSVLDRSSLSSEATETVDTDIEETDSDEANGDDGTIDDTGGANSDDVNGGDASNDDETADDDAGSDANDDSSNSSPRDRGRENSRSGANGPENRGAGNSSTNEGGGFQPFNTTPAGQIPTPQVANPGGFDQCVAPNIMLVVDNSTSISNSQLATMKTNIKSMITAVDNALPSTNWSGVHFRRPTSGGSSIIANPQGWYTGTQLQQIMNFVDAGTNNGYTPTASGIAARSGLSPEAGPNNQPRLMIVITDGAPNVVHGNANSAGTSTSNYVNGGISAVEQAEAARAAGWNTAFVMFGGGDEYAIGAMGQSAYNAYIAAVTNGVAGNQIGSGPAGMRLSVDDADGLADAITSALLDNCRGAVVVEKYIGEPGNAQLASTSWDFSATVSGGTADADLNNLSTSNGSVSFGIDLADSDVPATVSITEAAFDTNAFEFHSAQCSGGQEPGGNGTLDTDTRTISGIKVADDATVTCRFYNTPKPGQVEIKKFTWSASSSAWNLVSGTNSWRFDLENGTDYEDLTTGTHTVAIGNYTVSEQTPPQDWSFVAIHASQPDGQCPTAPVDPDATSSNSASVTVESGKKTVICAYNARDIEPLSVTKQGAGLYDKTVTWDLDKKVWDDDKEEWVDSLTLDLTDGEDVDVDYSYTYSRTNTESNFRASGTITIANPAGNPTAVIDDVVDDTATVGACKLNGTGSAVSFPYSLEAGQQLVCDWTASRNSSTSFTNEATVKLADGSPFEDASTEATITFGFSGTYSGPTEVDLTDQFDGNDEETLEDDVTGSGVFSEHSETLTCDDVTNWNATTGQGSYTYSNIARLRDDGTQVDSDTAQVTITCQQPKLTLKKVVQGGDAAANLWTLRADDNGPAGSSGVSKFVPADSQFTLSETGGDNRYVLNNIVCGLDGQGEDNFTFNYNAQAGTGALVMGNQDLTCTFTNNYDPAKVVLIKNFDPVDDGGQVDLSILSGGDVLASGERGHGGQIVFEGAPGNYQVAEAGTNLDWYDTSLTCESTTERTDLPANADVTSSPEFSVSNGETVTCTFTNSRKTADVTITKVTLDGAGEVTASDDDFAFTSSNVDDFALSTDNDANASETFTRYVGTEFSIEEDLSVGGLDATWLNTAVVCEPAGEASYGGDDEGRSATFTVPANGIECTFTNQLKTGSITVEKEIDWNGATPVNQAEPFEICLEGPAPSTETDCRDFTEDGQTETWDELLPGDYNVIETDPGFAWTVSYSDDTVTLDPGAEIDDIVVTNTRNRGSLEVTKDIALAGDIELPEDFAFTICIDGPSYPMDGDEFAEDACREFGNDGQTETWDDLIEGTYQVSELDPDSDPYYFLVSGEGSITVEPGNGANGEPNGRTITNTLLVGDLTVGKTIDWSGAPQDTTQTFEICIQGPSFSEPTAANGGCQLIEYSGPGAYTSGSVSWDPLLPGAYTITENFPDGDANEWTAEIDGSPVTVTGGSETASATITNTLKPGFLRIEKLYPDTCESPDQADWPRVLVGGNEVTDTDGCQWPAANSDAEYIEVPANVELDIREVVADGWQFVSFGAVSGQCGVQNHPVAQLGQQVILSVNSVITGTSIEDAQLQGGSVTIPPGVDCVVQLRNQPVGSLVITKYDNVPSTRATNWNFNHYDGGDEVFDNDVLRTVGDLSGNLREASVTRQNISIGDYAINELEGLGQCVTASGITDYQTHALVSDSPITFDEVRNAALVADDQVDYSITKGGTTYIAFANVSCVSVLEGANLSVFKYESPDGSLSGSTPLAGWAITIRGTDGLAVGTTKSLETNTMGIASFGTVAPGIYTICETPQDTHTVVGSTGNDGKGGVAGACREGVEVAANNDVEVRFFNSRNDAATPTPTPTDEPEETPTPTETPTDEPSDPTTPTATPTDEPSDPTTPTATPTDEPSDPASPTVTPTDEPSDPSTPTTEPTETPGSASTEPPAGADETPASTGTPIAPATGTGTASANGSNAVLFLLAAIAIACGLAAAGAIARKPR